MYSITHEMALDLVKYYAEQLNTAERNKVLSPKREENWVIAKDGFVQLLVQMKFNGHNIEEILQQVGANIHNTYAYKKIEVYFDGGARGNHDVNQPNQSAIAFVVYADDTLIHSYSEYIGSELDVTLGNLRYVAPATVNVAEYYALIKALEYLIDNNLMAQETIFKSDSTCVVNQVNLVHATRAAHLLQLRDHAVTLLRHLPAYKLQHIPREQNQMVDTLVNEVIDGIIT